MVALHQREGVGHGIVRAERDRLDDHPRLGALHLVDLGNLVGDREIAVDDPDSARARERDRKPRLGDGVHRGGDDRELEHDRPRQPGGRAHVVRQHARLGREQQHVVEREPFLAELHLPVELELHLSHPLDRGCATVV